MTRTSDLLLIVAAIAAFGLTASADAAGKRMTKAQIVDQLANSSGTANSEVPRPYLTGSVPNRHRQATSQGGAQRSTGASRSSAFGASPLSGHFSGLGFRR